MNVEEQVERVLRELDQRIMYIRHHAEFDEVFYICTECAVKEHDEVVPAGEEPKLECPNAT